MTIHEDLNSQSDIELELRLQKFAIDEHAIVAITDPSGVITYVNDRFCKISKYPREELIGKTHRVINSGYHPKSFFVEMWKTIAQGESWRGEICNRAKDGSLYWVDTTIVPFKSQSGKITQYVAIRADITDRKRMEQELSLHKYAIDEHAIVAITDPSGVITYVNDRFCKISKYSREELIGKTHRVINSGHHPKTFFVEMWKAIARGETWRGEICNRAKDGSLYWVDTTIVPFKSQSGQIAQYVAIRADITDRKHAEQELRRVNEELEQFVYTASHDLKTPLLSIEGFSGHMSEFIAAHHYDQLAECASRISRAVRRMRANVDDLLELSRIGRLTSECETVLLNPLLAELMTEHETEIAQAGATVVVDDGLPPLYGERVRIRQLFANLLINALRYGCSPGGNNEIRFQAKTVGKEVMVSVIDHGPGISEEYRNKVFELFQRLDTTKGGTGVGLSIVKRITQVHGGRVWIETTPGGGATFIIAMPVRSTAIKGRQTAVGSVS